MSRHGRRNWSHRSNRVSPTFGFRWPNPVIVVCHTFRNYWPLSSSCVWWVSMYISTTWFGIALLFHWLSQHPPNWLKFNLDTLKAVRDKSQPCFCVRLSSRWCLTIHGVPKVSWFPRHFSIGLLRRLIEWYMLQLQCLERFEQFFKVHIVLGACSVAKWWHQMFSSPCGYIFECVG